MKRKKQKWLSLLLTCVCLTGVAAVPITASESDLLQDVSAESLEEEPENSGDVQAEETAETEEVVFEESDEEQELPESIPEEPVVEEQTENAQEVAVEETADVESVPDQEEVVPDEPDKETEEKPKEVTENDPAASTRLLVKTDDASILDSDAVIGVMDDVYLLQFSSEQEAGDALASYEGETIFVAEDITVRAAAFEDFEIAEGETDVIMTEEENPFTEAEPAAPVASTKPVIALIDTGVSGKKIVSERYSVLGDDGYDRNGHGDSMLDTLRGFDPKAEVVSIKALDDSGIGTVSSLYAAIRMAIDMRVSVINLSLSAYSTGENEAVASVIREAVANGIIVVGAAGNNGADAGSYVPANIPEAVVIGACNNKGERLPSSNYGSSVDLSVLAGSSSYAAATLSGIISATGSVPGPDGIAVFAPNGPTAESDYVDGLCYDDGSGSFMTAGTSYVIHNAGGKRLSDVIPGLTYDSLRSWLGSHENDNYYLGTPYPEQIVNGVPQYILGRSGDCDNRNPNGDCGDIHGNDDYAGVPMMNCTGFVWHALWKASGLSYTDGINMIPAWGGIGAGAWKNFIQNNGLEYMTVKSGGAGEINQMLETAMWSAKDANGKLFLEKGDIIWFWVDQIPLASDDLPVNGYFGGLSDKCHVGIYWPKDGEQGNRWWDSIGICEYQGDEGVYLKNMLHGFTPKTASVAMTIVKLGHDSAPAYTKVNVQKASANTAMTEGNASYSFAGAKYGVFKSQADAEAKANAVTAFTTDASGYGESEEILDVGATYYLREIEPPTNGSYLLDNEIHAVKTVEPNKVTKETATKSTEAPVCGGVKIQKTDADRKKAQAQGDAVLSGATYTILNKTTNKTITISTDASGTAQTAADALPIGTYEITEAGPSAGYRVNSSWKQSFTISESGKVIDLTAAPCEEPVIRGGVKIQKTDADLKKAQAQGDATLEKAAFTITNRSKEAVYVEGKWIAAGSAVKTITTNTQGVAQTTSELLPYGTYEIVETDPSTGYRVNNGWKQSFQIKENGKIVDLTGSACEEPVIRGGVKIQKQDSVRKNTQPQGDASLEGAAFAITNKSKVPVVVDGKTVAAGAVAKTIKTDSKGVAQTAADALPYGTYEIVETDPSTGCRVNKDWKQNFTIRENGKVIDLTSKPCDEEVIRGGVKIQKTDADLKKAQAQGDAALEKASFAITNRSKESVYVEGKWYAAGVVVKTLTTDSKGIAQTTADTLPFGTYEIVEKDPSTGYLLNNAWKQTFQIREDGKVIDLTGNPCEEPVIRGGVKIKKQDDDYKDEASQGDASLQGAEFTITNKSKASVVVGGKEYAVDADVLTIVTDAQGIAQSAKDALPYGTYEIRETKPSEGYLLNEDWKQTFQIRENGKIIDLTEVPCDEKVIRGGVLVEKRDAELDKNEALGGASLAGIEFTVSNASPLRVWVNGESFEPESEIVKIYTDEEGHASLPENCLPYGTYVIQETKTNDSYLLSDGGPRTFEIRENGKIVTVTVDEEEMNFRDRVVRNDFHFNKIADSSNARMGNTAFAVTQLKTGEQHVIVTDRNGVYNSKSKVNPHSQNTNGNDFVLEKYADDIIPSAELDYKAGLWFSLGQKGSEAEVKDGLGALPYGEYRLQELRCESNIGYKLLDIRFFVETDQTVEPIIDLGTLTDDEEEKPEIGTTAVAKESGSHEVQSGKEVTIVDTVTYKNLIPGTEYKMHGTLMVVPTDAKDAQPLVANGGNVTAETVFTPEEADGMVEMMFTFDASALGGTKTVVFEEVRKGNLIIAAHADAEDEGQQVSIIDIGTTAVTEDTETHEVQAAKKVTIVDTVRHTGLTPGKKYEVKGVLMDAETGEELQVKGKSIKASETFTPSEADGTVEIEFTLKAADVAGKKTVVFEELYQDGRKIAVHADITDEDQTVSIIDIGTTAVDRKTGTHESQAAEEVIFTDTVSYTGLTPGKTYTVSGVLMDADTEKELFVDETPVTAEKTFTPETADGLVTIDFTLNTSALAGKTVVVFEDLYRDGRLIASHADIKDEAQSISVIDIGTTVTDKESGKQEMLPTEDTTLVDTVEYAGLTKGETYVLKGVLMDAETGEALLIDDEPVTAETEFKAKKADGTVEVKFTFDSSVLVGKKVVVFEDLYRDDVRIASHADLNDQGQTMTFLTPVPISIGTTVADKETGKQEVLPSEKTTLVDTVEYIGLTEGEAYVLKGTLMDAETGKELQIDGKPVTAETEFKAKKADGTVEVEFTFDSAALAGKKTVVFEDLYREEVKIATHADLNDQGQTMTFLTPEPEPTPEPTPEPEKPEETPTPTPEPEKPQETPTPTVTPEPTKAVTPTVTPTPTKTTTPAASTGGKTDTSSTTLKALPVLTGDNSHVLGYLSMLAAAAVLAVAAFIVKKRRK